MNTIFYILLSALVIWIMLSILPVLLPFLLVILIVMILVIWYIYRKVHKQINDFDQEFQDLNTDDDSQEFTFFDRYDEDNSVNDVIDVEYTETDASERDD